MNPFEELEGYRNTVPLADELIQKWVKPFYMQQGVGDKDDMLLWREAANEIDADTVRTLLGERNWRPRSVAGYFASINGYSELEDIIGTLLLKSEVCYAGQAYSIALAAFGTSTAKEYLKRYLDHYLTQRDLWYDQAEVLSALYHLDETEGERYLPAWTLFVSDKTNWDLNSSRQQFKKTMLAIRSIKDLK